MDRRKFLMVSGASALALAFLRRDLGVLNVSAATPSSMNLADRINATCNAVDDWNDPTTMYGGLANIGLIMSRSSVADYDSWITRTASSQDWLGVLHIKNFADHSGYSSSTIDQAVKLALTNFPMLEHSLPATNIDSEGVMWFYTFCKYALHGYKYSAEMNWEVAKWDKLAAFNYLAQVYDDFGRGFYALNDNDFAESEPYGTRWLDVGKIMGCFLIFYELGIEEAMDYAFKCWNELNTTFWRGNHYTYSTGVNGYEFSAMDVIPDCLKLETRNPGIGNTPGIANFGRLITDMQTRYLAGWQHGQWSSSFVDQTVTQHLSDDTGCVAENPELRMDGTLNAWILLNMSYSLLDSDSQHTIQSMLGGNGIQKASDGLWNSELKQSNGQFLLRTGDIQLADGTAQAALCLFLEGISVTDGPGLAIPFVSDYENDYSAMNSFHFGFDYVNNIVKIPVWGGTTVNFAFGSVTVPMTFRFTGIYSIEFSSDWTSICDCSLISGLNASECYMTGIETPVACVGTQGADGNESAICPKPGTTANPVTNGTNPFA